MLKKGMHKKKDKASLVLNDYYTYIMKAENKLSVFSVVPDNEKGFLLLRLPKRYRQDILKRLDDKSLISAINYLAPDDATDIIQELPKRKGKRIIKKLSSELKHKVEFLLRFNPRTAAGIMNIDYIEVEPDYDFRKVSRLIRKHEKRTGKVPSIIVVENGFLVGELPHYELGIHTKTAKIRKFIKKLPAVKYDANADEVIRVFKSHKHSKIAVLNDGFSILGLIYSDDILALIEKETSNGLYDFAGVRHEEDILDSIIAKVRSRSGWLIINLVTAFIASAVVSLFQETISAFVLLAIYMPIVAGMGGNAGTQALAVTVRGLALKEIELKKSAKVLFNEVCAGAINGFIVGVIVALVAINFNKSPMLGFVIFISMILNLMFAGFFGVLIPLTLKMLGKDPASSAVVFITTATDVIGFFSFLGLASLLL